MARRKRDDKTKDLFAYAEDNRPSIVYMATNTVNGKRYIGITRRTLEVRARDHFKTARRRVEAASPFHRAIRRYGEEAFKFSVLLQCETYRDAGIHEMLLIAELAPEYNASNGGESIAYIGFRPRRESVEKMRRALKANPARYWLGKKRPDIAEKQRKRLTGRADLMAAMHKAAHTPEARAKMSATKRSRPTPPKQLEAMKRRRKPVICLNDGRTFSCAREVAESMGYPLDSVRRVLTGERNAIHGYRFAYIDKGRPA